MAKITYVNVGQWWKWSKYEIRGGYFRPSAGAELNPPYDPWKGSGQQDHQQTRSSTPSQSNRRPYQSLFSALEQKDEKGLLAWVNEFGLLGILPHYLELAITALPPLGIKPTERRRLAVVRSFLRHARHAEGSEFRPRALQRIEQNLLKWQDWRVAYFPTSTGLGWGESTVPGPKGLAFIRSTDAPHRKIQVLPLSRALRPYFPDGTGFYPRWSAIPAPYSRDFWKYYAERVTDFKSEAMRLREWIARLAKASPKSEDEQQLDALNGLLIGSHPRFEFSVGARPSKSHLLQRWVSPSLLGSLSLMALQDAAFFRLAQCPSCGNPFATGRSDAKFCSDKCRDRIQKRRRRQKNQPASAPR